MAETAEYSVRVLALACRRRVPYPPAVAERASRRVQEWLRAPRSDLFVQDLEARSGSAEPDYPELLAGQAAALDRLAAELVAAWTAAFAPLRQSFPQRSYFREPQF